MEIEFNPGIPKDNTSPIDKIENTEEKGAKLAHDLVLAQTQIDTITTQQADLLYMLMMKGVL